MRIDHLVWYNADLAEGQRFFSERMDCASAYGGEHPGEGTANAVMRNNIVAQAEDDAGPGIGGEA